MTRVEPRLHADRAARRDRDPRDHRRHGVRRVSIASSTNRRSRASARSVGKTIQLAMRLVTQDLAQLHPRATREELGENYQPSLLADPSAQFALEFSRGGWANPGGLAARHGAARRVRLGRRQARALALGRHGSHAVDAAGANRASRRRHERRSPVSRHCRASGISTGRRSIGAGRQSLVTRPRAVEFALELEDFGRVFRLVETSG